MNTANFIGNWRFIVTHLTLFECRTASDIRDMKKINRHLSNIV